jgi:hypothetical protein
MSKGFKKGNTFGKAGRIKIPQEMHLIKSIPKDHFKLLISKYLQMELSELEHFMHEIKAKRVPVADAYIISLITKGLKEGDVNIMEWLAQRTVGKVKEDVEFKVVKTVHSEILDYINQNQSKIDTDE